MGGFGTADSPTRRFAGGLTRGQFLAIVCLFWVYVTVSNLLYGYSMRTGIAHLTTRQASLEDVFVNLTGRHLREE